MKMTILSSESAGSTGEQEDAEAEDELGGHHDHGGETKPGVETEHVRYGRLGEAVRLPD